MESATLGVSEQKLVDLRAALYVSDWRASVEWLRERATVPTESFFGGGSEGKERSSSWIIEEILKGVS